MIRKIIKTKEKEISESDDNGYDVFVTNEADGSKNNTDGLTERSEEVADIIERFPTGWTNIISVIMTVVVLVTLFLAFFIKYPDTVSGQLIITGQQAPVRIVSSIDGRLHLCIPNKAVVHMGQCVGYIESGARYDDIMQLDSICGIKLRPDVGIDLPDSLNLGALSARYNDFALALFIASCQIDNNIDCVVLKVADAKSATEAYKPYVALTIAIKYIMRLGREDIQSIYKDVSTLGYLGIDVKRDYSNNKFYLSLAGKGDCDIVKADNLTDILAAVGTAKALSLLQIDRPFKAEFTLNQNMGSFAEDIARTTKAGMNGHVSKPIESAVLSQTMQRLITEWDARRGSSRSSETDGEDGK